MLYVIHAGVCRRVPQNLGTGPCPPPLRRKLVPAKLSLSCIGYHAKFGGSLLKGMSMWRKSNQLLFWTSEAPNPQVKCMVDCINLPPDFAHCAKFGCSVTSHGLTYGVLQKWTLGQPCPPLRMRGMVDRKKSAHP